MFNKLRKVFNKNKDVGVENDDFSAKAIELKYWKNAGVKKGIEFYSKYLKKFNLEKESFRDKSVGDFGCGPFKGLLSTIKVKKAYPIDILADDYNKMMNYGEDTINLFDGVKTNLPSDILDQIFCCNAIDHTKFPENIANEIHRLLKTKGKMFLHVHLRSEEELNTAHPLAWNEEFCRELFSKKFEVNILRIDEIDEVNGNQYNTLYAILTKI